MYPSPFSVLVCCYGEFSNYSIRCLNSLVDLASGEYEIPIHVGCNECTPETVQHVIDLYNAEKITSMTVSQLNRNKDPMMRSLIEAVDTEFLLWLDDDSHFVKKNWDRRIVKFIESKPDLDVAGHIFYCHRSKEYQSFLKRRPWYVDRRPKEDVVWFPTGGFWIARTKFLQYHDWPDRKMIKKQDDLLLGDLCEQHNAKLIDFGSNKSIMDSIIISDGDRRGYGEGSDGWLG